MASNEAVGIESAEKASQTNKRVVRALVFPIQKRTPGEETPPSKQMPEDPWGALYREHNVVEPPLDPLLLSMLPELNSEMVPSLEAMEQNIEGFGHRFVRRVKDQENEPKSTEKAVLAERTRLTNFFLYANLELSYTQLRKQRRRDLETTGNAYWEVLRSVSGKVQGFEHMPSYQVRISSLDQDPIKVKVPIIWINEDGSAEVKKIDAWRRFRRFVQIKEGKKRWFKAWGDPRTYDNDTGHVVLPEKLIDFDGMGNPMPESRKANEVVHWRLYCARSPYGLPRFIGNLLSVFGDRSAAEINFKTFRNNNVPSMIIAVSNGQLTQGSLDRIKEYTESLVSGQDNYSRFLLLEAESQYEGEDQGQMKIQVTPLTGEQHTDAMFQEYSKGNQDRIRRSWRLPPIFVGRADDYTRATADTSRRLADEQIYAPERDEFDLWTNLRLFPEMEVIHHLYKSNSPNTTDNAQLVRILGGAEKTGGMTPRIARWVLEDILGMELGPISKELKADVPFSLQMAEAVKNQADAAEPGQQVTALKMLQVLDQLMSESDYQPLSEEDLEAVERMVKMRDLHEARWRREVFGEDHVQEES